VPNKATKRAADHDGKPKKRQKKPELLVPKEDTPKKPTPKKQYPKETKSSNAAANDSESDLSDVVDEEPKAKSKRRKSSPGETKSKKKVPSKGKLAAGQPLDPEAEEIKSLQGWLVKCGIRKMWYKELAPYDTPKGKIRHLKEMLAEAGMTGRYSTEKASAIRDERELKADLEAVQEGAKYWGASDSDKDSNGRPKRRLARGLRELDFLNDDDGEETD